MQTRALCSVCAPEIEDIPAEQLEGLKFLCPLCEQKKSGKVGYTVSGLLWAVGFTH